MNEEKERFSSALHTASRSWRQAVDRRLKFLGLSQAGWMTIAIVAREASPLSQSELADRLGVEGATMVAMVDRLVRAGLATREASSADRRIKRVVLTQAGAALYDKVRTEAAALREELLTDIDPKKLVIATELLERLQQLIDARR